MSPLKSSSYLLLTTAIRAAAGVAVLKLVALNTGVDGFGELSQFMGVIALVGMLAAGGIGSGLTRSLAASLGFDDRQRWYRAAFLIALAAGASLALLTALAAYPLSLWLWGGSHFTAMLLGLAFAQLGIGGATLAQAAAVARGQHAFVAQFVCIGSVFGLIAVAIGVSTHGVTGAAWGLVAHAAMPGLVALALKHAELRSLCLGTSWWREVDPERLRVLMRFAAVPLVGALSLGISQIVMREWVAESAGWQAVGYWQAVSRLADLYLQFISVLALGVLLPRWAQLQSYRATTPLLFRMGGSLLGLTLLIGLVLLFARDFVLALLFSASFLPAGALMPWQVTGDLFRVLAVCMSTALMARGEAAWPAGYEMAQGLLILGGTGLLLPYLGGEAPVVAYCIAYLVLAVTLGALWRHRIAAERRVCAS